VQMIVFESWLDGRVLFSRFVKMRVLGDT
jgi:hypothetical protein